MTPVWYIQIRESSSELQKVVLTLQEMGHTIHCEKYIPFGGMTYEFLPKDKPVVALTAISPLKHILKNTNFIPCAWCDWDALSCHTYYTHWGESILQQEYAFYPLGEIIRLKDKIYDWFGEDDRIFIRPDANNKTFTGEVVAKSKFHIWHSVTMFDEPELNIMCVVAKPTEILAEYRLIVADGKVVAGSQYINERILSYDRNFPKDIIPFAEKAIENWQPHPIFCLDVANTPDGYKIIECGSMNCAGFYDCDLRAVLSATSKIAIREWEDYIKI